MISQIEEQDSAMIPSAMQPAGQLDGLADIGLAQFAAIMGAIGVHGGLHSGHSGPRL
jgi:hypothetical protein